MMEKSKFHLKDQKRTSIVNQTEKKKITKHTFFLPVNIKKKKKQLLGDSLQVKSAANKQLQISVCWQAHPLEHIWLETKA